MEKQLLQIHLSSLSHNKMSVNLGLLLRKSYFISEMARIHRCLYSFEKFHGQRNFRLGFKYEAQQSK